VNIEDLMRLEDQTVIKYKAEGEAKMKLEHELSKLKQGRQDGIDQEKEEE
jgi:hypothetical protein